MKKIKTSAFKLATGFLFVGASAFGHGIDTKTDKKVKPDFDITRTTIKTEGNVATFEIEVSGKAGHEKPKNLANLPVLECSRMFGRPQLIQAKSDSKESQEF